MSIADFFFGRKQNKTNSRRSVKLNRNAVRTRTLSMEPLETRDLLSVTTGPISDSDYDALRTQYPDFNLPADQSTLNVMTISCNLSELKSAISTASSSSTPDLILVKTTNSSNTITYTSSSDLININGGGSITIIGWGTSKLTLNANDKCRVLTTSVTTCLGNMILTKGRISSSGGLGGGIYSSSSLTLSNCSITSNTVSTGSSTSSYAYGGGIYSTGSLKMTNCSISSNSVSSLADTSYNGTPSGSFSSYGGGIYSTGSLTMTNCTVSGNSLSSRSYYGTAYAYGSGIYTSSNSSLTFTNCVISNNSISAYSSSSGKSSSGGDSVYTEKMHSTISISGSSIISKDTSPSTITSSGNTQISNNTLTNVSISKSKSGGKSSVLNNNLTNASISITGIVDELSVIDCTLHNSSVSISGEVATYSVVDSVLTSSSVKITGSQSSENGYISNNTLTASSISTSDNVTTLSIIDKSLTNSSISISGNVTELSVNNSTLTDSSISISGVINTLSIVDSNISSTNASKSIFIASGNALITNSSLKYASISTSGEETSISTNTLAIGVSISVSGGESSVIDNSFTGGASITINEGESTVSNNALTDSAYIKIAGGDSSVSDNSFENNAFITITEGDVSVLNNTIIGTGSGNGITISGGSATLSGNSITDILISVSGGNAAILDKSLINTSLSISGGNTSILDCALSNGSVSISSGNTSISDSSLTNAPVSISGGKASLVNSSLTDGAYISITGGKTSIANSSIVGTGSGKGIDITSGGVDTNLIVSNSLIRDYEYGIYTGAQVNAAIVNSTITNNSSYGVCVDYSSALFNICNSIVARNYFFSDVYKVADATVNAYNSLSSYTNWTVGYDNIFYIGSIPLFADEENSDYRLAENSPAINTGNNAYAVDPTGQALTTDLAGNPRILDSRVDIGAYEYDSTSYTKLSVPEFTVSANGTTAIVNISSVENASAYQIEYSLNSDFTGAAVLDAQAGENAISNLQESQTYYIRVKALGEANYSDSDFSETASVTLDVSTTPLTGLTLSTTTPEVGMTITTELTPSDATANYQWYSGETAIEGATASSFTVTEEQIGQTIKCVATGTGSFTGEVSAATTVAVPVPTASLSAPTELTLSALNTRVTAAWSAVENASSYTLLYQIDGTDGWTTITDIQGTSTSFIGTIDTTYNVKVKANGTGDYSDSPYSEIETISLDVVVKPTIAINGKKVTVKWNDDSPAADAVRYRVVGTTKWTVKKLKAGVTEFSFNGALGTNYEIEVLLDQQETNVLQGSATVLDQPKLKADKAAIMDDTFQVSVTNYAAKNLATNAKQAIVVVNGVQTAFNIENQQGESDLASGGKVAFSNGLFTFSEMTSNTSYKVQISFSDSVSVSTASAALTVKTLKSPYLAPVITSATAVSDTSIVVAWETALGKKSNTPAQKYTVQYSLDGKKWSNATTAATGNSYTIQRLKGGNVYQVRVFATKDNAFEASAPSDVLTAETLTAPKTAIEKNSIKDDSFQVNVTNYPTTNLVKATSITVKSDKFGETVINLENGAGSSAFDNGMTVAFNNGALTFANAPSNNQQKIQVNFSDGVCTTAWSAALTVKTAIASYSKPVLSSPTVVSSTSVLVEWSPAVGKGTDIQAQSYTVQYTTDGSRWINANAKVVGTSFTINGLKTGTTYLVAVIANKDARFNASLPSESQQVTPL